VIWDLRAVRPILSFHGFTIGINVLSYSPVLRKLMNLNIYSSSPFFSFAVTSEG
jgi:hypothetical protein